MRNKSFLSILSVALLMIIMALPTNLVGMPIDDEKTNNTSARGDTTCDADGDCPDGQICEGGTCVDGADDGAQGGI